MSHSLQLQKQTEGTLLFGIKLVLMESSVDGLAKLADPSPLEPALRDTLFLTKILRVVGQLRQVHPSQLIKRSFASTWGEFDFGSRINSGNSGFDVSAIAAQNAGLGVQGMKKCDVLTLACSSIAANAASVNNAYTRENFDKGGVGGNLAPGPVRLNVTLSYSYKSTDNL